MYCSVRGFGFGFRGQSGGRAGVRFGWRGFLAACLGLCGGLGITARVPAQGMPASLPAQDSAAPQSAELTPHNERARLHSGPEWDSLAPHLPDPKTATAAQLEVTGDVLRARRFPEDALDYYNYAVARGGNVPALLNKMGIVRLELRQNNVARVLFQRTVRAQKKNAVAWNNLGVTDYSDGKYRNAISEYRHALKLDPRSATFHSNLAMAYFENKDLDSAREQFAQAVRLDPSIMQGRDGNGGVSAHVIGTSNYGELCFEMARVYARRGELALMRLWVAKSAESGYDVREALRRDPAMAVWGRDPEVRRALANADQMRARNVAVSRDAPALPMQRDE